MEGQSKPQPTERQQRRQQFWNKYRNSRKKHSKPEGTKHVSTEEKVKMENGKAASVGSDQNDKEESEKKRYLLFVGNLPFTVAAKEVKRHFRCAGGVVDFRLMTKKETEESKGCGFLEFDNAGSMWKALNLHHSELGGRKINVELTCGGGGKGDKRGKRLKNKKRKLRQERKEKSSKLKTETGDVETVSAPKTSSQTEKLASGVVCSSMEQREEKSKDRSKKKTGASKAMRKKKTGMSDGPGKGRKMKHRDHSARGTAAGRKRKPTHQNTSGFRRAKVSRQDF